MESNGRFSNPFESVCVAQAGGRQHYAPRRSDSFVPRRLKKEVHQNLDSEPRPEGTRKVPQPDRSHESTRANRKHYTGSQGHHDNCTTDTWDHSFVQSKMRVVCDDGERAVEQPAREMSMERTMNRKQRVTCVDRMRNGVPQMSNGDKPYNNPEYCAKFWAQEGVVPSSKMHTRGKPVHHTKTLELDEEMLMWKAPKRATFAEKQKDLERRAEMSSVSLLPKARKQNAISKYSSLLAENAVN